MNAVAANFPALVLNADFRPLSYFPLSLWSWQETVKAVFLDRVNIVSEYDHKVHSPSMEMRLPSVIALRDYVRLSVSPSRSGHPQRSKTISLLSLVNGARVAYQDATR